MAQRDPRNQQDDFRDQRRGQMDQYAENHRQQGSQAYGERSAYQPQGGQQNNRYDDGQRGNHNNGSDLRHNDPAQASYGRFGAPDVHNAPTGGYRRDERADPGYNHPGYTHSYGNRDDRGEQGPSQRSQGGYGGAGQGPDQGQSGYGYGGYNQQDLGRFQGAAGGYASNRGAYAGTRGYGNQGDQLGYGSGHDGDHGGGQHHDPEYTQWRHQQMRSLDEDYHAWRGERYKKFSDEFGEWRKNRPAQQDGQRSNPGDAAGADAKLGVSSSGNAGTSGSK